MAGKIKEDRDVKFLTHSRGEPQVRSSAFYSWISLWLRVRGRPLKEGGWL